jgi:hypothetical protein
MSQIATVSLRELVDAVDFVSGSDIDQFSACICTRTTTGCRAKLTPHHRRHSLFAPAALRMPIF